MEQHAVAKAAREKEFNKITGRFGQKCSSNNMDMIWQKAERMMYMSE